LKYPLAKSALDLSLPAGTKITRMALILPPGLSFEQWEAIAAPLSAIESGYMWWIGDWWHYGEHAYGKRAAQAVDSERFAFQTFADAGWVAGKIETSRRREVLSWSHHKEVAGRETKAEQDELLDLAEQNGWTRAELRQEVRRRKRAAEAIAGEIKGKFRVVYADPPWQYADAGVITGQYGRAEKHYSTMSIDELCALDIKNSLADNAVLFLWVTSPMLQDSFKVIEAWGFQYKTSFIWDKVGHNPGHYNSVRHELLLVATRGSCIPDAAELHDSVISIERSAVHSEKPEYFRELIDKLYIHGKRIELFARKEVPGWETWGKQAGAASSSAAMKNIENTS